MEKYSRLEVKIAWANFMPEFNTIQKNSVFRSTEYLFLILSIFLQILEEQDCGTVSPFAEIYTQLSTPSLIRLNGPAA